MSIELYECGRCSKRHDDEDEARECCAPEVKTVYACAACYEGDPEHATTYETEKKADACTCGVGPHCLCGTRLTGDDERPSLILGSVVYCLACRGRILSGIPSGEAIRTSFAENVGLVPNVPAG